MAVYTRSLRLSLIFLGLCTAATAQHAIEGKLYNEEDRTPIAYANIGILNTPVGTISNPDGSFEILIPKKYLNDTLLFSALGFERKSYHLASITGTTPLIIFLREETTVLKSITVKSRKSRPVRSFEFGNRMYNTGSIYVDSVAAGSAMALLIENKFPSYHPELTRPYFVTNAKLRISFNTFNDFKLRLRFLSVDEKTGLPSADLIKENIIVTSSIRKGWVNFDLSQYTIRIDERAFYLVFEWLIDDEERLELVEQYREFKRQYPRRVSTDTLTVEGERITYYSWHGYRAGTSFASSSDRSAVDSFKCFYRNNSYGRWRRSSTILAASVTLANY
jgi:hypothetical protein